MLIFKQADKLDKTVVKRFRTWLFIASVLTVSLGPIVVGVSNRVLDAKFQVNSPILVQPIEQDSPMQTVCVPIVDQAAYDALDKLVLDPEYVPVISLRMAELFAADQAVRQLPIEGNPQKVNEEDTQRRIEVLGYIKDGQIRTARDLVYAAFIFQHGECSEHYRLGNRLAQIAMDSGYSEARWIYAATLDRYLMSLGQLQKFGTQYVNVDREYKLYPVDPATTDAERAKYTVPPLNEALSRKPVGMGSSTVRRQWLETWWLTLIGGGFAALSAVIGVVDAEPNALPGRIVLTIALLVYAVSMVGHYTQINAVSQGTSEIQHKIWGVANGLMIMVWLAFAMIETFRCLKTKSA